MIQKIVNQILKPNNIPFIECCVLSSLMFLQMFFISILTYNAVSDTSYYKSFSLILIGLCVLNPILHFILYSTLKKKFNFEINVFFYGVGFVSTCFMIIYLITDTVDAGIVMSRSGNPVNEMIGKTMSFYLFPLILLYYSYAALIKTNGEKGQKIISYLLTAITAICLIALTVFEMSRYQIPYVSVFFLFYELYFVYCLIYKTHLFNLRLFSWGPFVFSWILFWHNFALRLTWAF